MIGAGDKAEASLEIPNNSQNMNLLEANVSSISVLNNKNDNKNEGRDDTKISEDALIPTVSPLGVLSPEEEYEDFSTFDEMSIYVVKNGDTVSDIAKMFEVSSNTILWANGLKKGEKLVAGDTLIILPVDGLKHTVKKGDTIKNIAKAYEVEPADIYDFNDISENDIIIVGQEIIIPGGELKETEAKKTAISSNKNTNKNTNTTTTNKNIRTGGSIPNNYYSSNNSKSYPGYYIKPVICKLTQGRHNRNAIDLGCPIGTSVKASASGKVIFAKMGWNGAFGNLIIIAHPNGSQTFYAHLSKINVSLGEQVKQGQVIGNVGNTGRSTGPHLHFEVRGAMNPQFNNSWAK